MSAERCRFWQCIGSWSLIALLLGGGTALPAASSQSTPQQAESPIAGSKDAVDPLEMAIVREISRAHDFLDKVELARSDLLRRGQNEKKRASAAAERSATLALELLSCPAGSSAADQLYDALVGDLIEARALLKAALDGLRAPPAAPRFAAALDPANLQTPSLAPQAKKIQKVYGQIAAARDRLVQEQNQLAWAAVQHRAARVRSLNELRIGCLPKLSPDKHDRMLGFTREGIAQLRREILQLTLSARLYLVTRLHDAHLLPAALRDIFEIGEITYALIRIALILAVALFLRRRIRPIFEGARGLLISGSRSVGWNRHVGRALGLLEVLFPWSLFLIALHALRWGLGDAAAWPEFHLLFRIGIFYGSYRLAADVLFRLTVNAARHYRLRMDEARTDLITRSLRSILRAITATAILLALSEQFLGRGYLYHLMVDLTWLVLILAMLRVLSRWRSIITDTYLQKGPPGRLADLVSRTRDRWYGVFLATASLAWLTGRATLALASDFAMGFDETRIALAFLFRRRVEKQAQRLGYSAGVLESLPPDLIQAFVPEPIREGPGMVDHFPGLDHFGTALSEWREDRHGGSFLLVGSQGMGKTSWLRRIRVDDLTVSQELCPGAPPAAGLDRLQEDLLAGSPRLVILEGLQEMFLATIGGYEALESFVSLMHATNRKVFWLCSISAFAFEHLAAVHAGRAAFSFRQVLPAWSEARIRDLIRARMAASGVALTFEDLVVDRLEGVEGEARLLETEEGYIRLLWHYSEGNPSVALHYWLCSLVPESSRRVHVRLYKSPPVGELENVAEDGLFLLAAILLHDTLTLPAAILVSGQPESTCGIYLERLADLGVIQRTGVRYRLCTHWQPAALRLLRRKNFLAD